MTFRSIKHRKNYSNAPPSSDSDSQASQPTQTEHGQLQFEEIIIININKKVPHLKNLD
jgi:hypothetical protein